LNISNQEPLCSQAAETAKKVLELRGHSVAAVRGPNGTALVVQSRHHLFVVFAADPRCNPPERPRQACPLDDTYRCGYVDARALWAETPLHERVATLVRDLRGSREVVVTGHGLGGGMAQIFVHIFFSPLFSDQLRHPLLEVLTFGSFAVGDKQFAENLNDCATTPWVHFRFVSCWDTGRLLEQGPAFVHSGRFCLLPFKPPRRPFPRFLNGPSRLVVLQNWVHCKWARALSPARHARLLGAAHYAFLLQPA
jgi:hypothetical protein